MKRKIEVFTTGCPVCNPVVAMVEEVACDSCEIAIHNLNEGFNNKEVKDKLVSHGINRITSTMMDGKSPLMLEYMNSQQWFCLQTFTG